MRRVSQLAVASTLLALTLRPASARAGTVGGEISRSGEGLSYVANAGETNDLTIAGSRSTYSVHDGAGVTAGMDCKKVDATNAICKSSRISFHGIVVDTEDGNDIVHISSNTSTVVRGGTGNDWLFGGSRDVEFRGGDALFGGPGGDTMGGALGVRTFVSYSFRTSPVSVSEDGVANDGERGEGDNVLPSILAVTGSHAADRLTGSPGRDLFAGYEGNDMISGLGGSDRLSGGQGDDLIVGGQGDDRLAGGSESDTLKGRFGDDALRGNTGVDSLSGGEGNDSLDSVDRWADSLACGAGTDSASVDKHDVVARDCENVTIEEPHRR